MEKPINPKINKAQLDKLTAELARAMEVIVDCRQLLWRKIEDQLAYEEALRHYKKTMAHEKMIRTVFRMRKSGSTFAEIGKKVGKNRRDVGAIYREGEPGSAKTEA